MNEITKLERRILKRINKKGGCSTQEIRKRFGEDGVSALEHLAEIGYIESLKSFMKRHVDDNADNKTQDGAQHGHKD